MHYLDKSPKGNPVSCLHFESTHELLTTEPESGRYRKLNAVAFEGIKSSSYGADRKWWGESSLDVALTKLRDGWPEGLKRGLLFIERLSFPPKHVPTVRRVIRRGDHGDEVDMQRVYRGDLDTAWSRRVKGPGSMLAKPTVTILCNTGINVSQNSEDLFWTGAVVASMASWLVESGRSVRVLSHQYSKEVSRGVDTYTSVVVKDFTSPLDLEILFGQTALGAMHRYAMFYSLCLRSEYLTYDYMGYPQSTVDYSSPLLGLNNDEVISVNAITSQTAAQRYLDQQHKHFGGV